MFFVTLEKFKVKYEFWSTVDKFRQFLAIVGMGGVIHLKRTELSTGDVLSSDDCLYSLSRINDEYSNFMNWKYSNQPNRAESGSSHCVTHT